MTNEINYRAELYLRPFTHHLVEERRKSVVKQLEQLRDLDILDEFDAHTWADEISKESDNTTELDSLTKQKFREFKNWAEKNDASLKPFFEEEKATLTTLTMDQSCHKTVTTLPVMALALYEDDDLRTVFPHSNEDEYRGVTDILDEIELEGMSGVLSQLDKEKVKQ